VANVLLVDDHPGILAVLTKILTKAGHRPVTASNGREALKRLTDGDFDLIITDINMPDMDGIELILALKESSGRVPIIAVSGGGIMPAESLLHDASAFGAVDVIPKPFRNEDLLRLVEKHLGA
jgi:CheY-like chemotaxis protein